MHKRENLPCLVDPTDKVNPLNPELNPICYLLALLGAHHFLHASRIRVKSLTLRLLMSYIYIYIYIYDISSLRDNVSHWSLTLNTVESHTPSMETALVSDRSY